MMDGKAWHLMANHDARLDQDRTNFKAKQKQHSDLFFLRKKVRERAASKRNLRRAQAVKAING
jgi:hypothetical protein